MKQNQAAKAHSYWLKNIKELAALAKKKTTQQLADHYQCSYSAMHQTLKRHSLSCKPAESHKWVSNKKKLMQQATALTTAQMATHWGLTPRRMHTVLERLGIKAQPEKRKPKPAPVKATPIPISKHQPTKTQACKQRITIPEGVHIKHIPLPTPMGRICNSSMREPLITSKHCKCQ